MKLMHRRILLRATLISLPVVFTSAAWTLAADKSAKEQKPVAIALYPAPEPKPALKYQLLPPLIERRPGNAAVWWNRVLAERAEVFCRFYADKGPWDKIDKWMQMPIGAPKEKEYREKVVKKELIYFPDMDRAARFESCNWELPLHEGDAINMLLPEAQQSRSYARIIAANTRYKIALGEYDQAVEKLQTGHALARDVAEGPTIIHALIGTAIVGLMDDQIEQFIQQPDAPNLYWALSTLPRPLIDYHLGFEGERFLLYLTFPELENLDKKVLSLEEADRLLAKVIGLCKMEGFVGDKAKAKMPTKQEVAEKIYPRAKQYLIDRGRSAAEVEALPKAQVVLVASMRVYDEIRDDVLKWAFLPYVEQGAGREAAIDHLMKNAPSREFLPIATQLLPALQAAKTAETRIQWKLALLRIFEALRMYAANHDGRWPDRLDDIKEVPIPNNPFDGKPFLYRRDGDKAVLNCEAGPPNVPWRYEITFGRKNK
jgi:hypothetical protein